MRQVYTVVKSRAQAKAYLYLTALYFPATQRAVVYYSVPSHLAYNSQDKG